MISELPTLYSRTSKGAVQQWTIEVEGDRYRTKHGQIDGAIQVTEWTVAKSKNSGRANQTSPEEQAIKAAKSDWTKKRDSGYFEHLEDIDNEYFTDPMLAQKFEDREDELKYPLLSQPKLDGIRCIAKTAGLTSRNGKVHGNCKHIHDALKPLLQQYSNLILDGELYCDKFATDFNAICSIVKKQKPTQEQRDLSATYMQYHVYDIVDTEAGTFERNARLRHFVGKYKEFYCDRPRIAEYIQLVDTDVVDSRIELDTLYERYVDAGCEGQMVRTDAPYKLGGRSASLLKRKQFQDREYKILKFIEGDGNRTGTVGAVMLENDDGSTFRSNIKGTRDYLRELLLLEKYNINKLATVKFFNLTPDNVPRFPFIIGIRDYE